MKASLAGAFASVRPRQVCGFHPWLPNPPAPARPSWLLSRALLSVEPRAFPTGALPDCGPFNCSNCHRRFWSWNYRGCWHQTCPPVRAALLCRARSAYVSSLLLPPGSEQVARLLRSLDLGAVSQPPSPESNPNPPFPVAALVGPYPTTWLMGQSPVWLRAAPRRRPASPRRPASLLRLGRRFPRMSAAFCQVGPDCATEPFAACVSARPTCMA